MSILGILGTQRSVLSGSTSLMVSRLLCERMGDPDELRVSSSIDVLSKADELRRSVVGDAARRSWSPATSFEARNMSLRGVVSVGLTVEKCKVGDDGSLYSNDIKGAEPGRLRLVLI
jgi:hypothetical protein